MTNDDFFEQLSVPAPTAYRWLGESQKWGIIVYSRRRIREKKAEITGKKSGRPLSISDEKLNTMIQAPQETRRTRLIRQAREAGITRYKRIIQKALKERKSARMFRAKTHVVQHRFSLSCIKLPPPPPGNLYELIRIEISNLVFFRVTS